MTEAQKPGVNILEKASKAAPEVAHHSGKVHPSNKVSGAEFSDEFVHDLHKYHSSEDKVKLFNEVREACELLFKVIAKNCPQCADRTTALQTVRLARMWANSAIALDKP